MGNLARRVSELELTVQKLQDSIAKGGVDAAALAQLNRIESELSAVKTEVTEKTNGLPHVKATADAAVTKTRQIEEHITTMQIEIDGIKIPDNDQAVEEMKKKLFDTVKKHEIDQLVERLSALENKDGSETAVNNSRRLDELEKLVALHHADVMEILKTKSDKRNYNKKS